MAPSTKTGVKDPAEEKNANTPPAPMEEPKKEPENEKKESDIKNPEHEMTVVTIKTHQGMPVKAVIPKFTQIYQYGKLTYSLQVGQRIEVCEPLANSLVGREEAIWG